MNRAPIGDVSHVKVVVRVRPQNETERVENKKIVTKVIDDQVLIFDPKEDEEDFYYRGQKQSCRNLLKRDNKDVRFMFDRVFDGDVTNQMVYENTIGGLLEGLLNGYNCTAFAYGATGAGKTFTMLGNTYQPGIIYLTVKELFQRIEEVKEEKNCEVSVSYLEVYNELIKDLLVPSKPLLIREDIHRGVVVSGLTYHKPTNPDELFELLKIGNTNRTQHPTDANAESSRSHAVFTVIVKQRDRTAALSENVKIGKMCLVDLAGSERATMITKHKSARMREGANINKSLLALGSCISALADKKKSSHVPYRNSKLTHLLKDSLGGNCRTVMIAAVGPSITNFEDTYNTLRYADRAKNIQISLKKNAVNVDIHMAKYSKVVEVLRQEVHDLKAKLKQYEDGELDSSKKVARRQSAIFGTPKIEDIERMKKLFHDVFDEKRLLMKDLLELESYEKDLETRAHFRQRHIDQLSLMSTDQEHLDQTCRKTRRFLNLIETKKERTREKQGKVLLRLKENEARFQRIKSECKLIGADGKIPEVLVQFESALKSHVELSETRFKCKHQEKFIREQQKESEINQKILKNLLPFSKELYLMVKGYEIATQKIQDQFTELIQQVAGAKEVAWADMDPPPKENGSLKLTPIISLTVSSGEGFTPQLLNEKKSHDATPHLKLTIGKHSCITAKNSTPNPRSILKSSSRNLFGAQLQLDEVNGKDTFPFVNSSVSCDLNSTFTKTGDEGDTNSSLTESVNTSLLNFSSRVEIKCATDVKLRKSPSFNFFPLKEKLTNEGICRSTPYQLEVLRKLGNPIEASSISDNVCDARKPTGQSQCYKMRQPKRAPSAKENHPYLGNSLSKKNAEVKTISAGKSKTLRNLFSNQRPLNAPPFRPFSFKK